MSLVITTARLPDIADKVGELLSTYTYRLFTNDFTPVPGQIAANFTEAAWPGYAGKPANNWLPAAVDDNVGRINHPVLAWIRNGAGGNVDVYGYYVTNNLGEVVYAERRAGGAVTIPQDGAYVVEPTFYAGNVPA